MFHTICGYAVVFCDVPYYQTFCSDNWNESTYQLGNEWSSRIGWRFPRSLWWYWHLGPTCEGRMSSMLDIWESRHKALPGNIYIYIECVWNINYNQHSGFYKRVSGFCKNKQQQTFKSNQHTGFKYLYINLCAVSGHFQFAEPEFNVCQIVYVFQYQTNWLLNNILFCK